MDKKPFYSEHFSDEDGNPSGGRSYGPGFSIAWQRGPLGRGADRREPNGAFVETILEAAKDRLNHYQASKFNCDLNQRAIEAIDLAVAALNERTADREKRDVEGTHEE